jgi:hypothetical protein
MRAGRNRSGLIVVFVLRSQGWSAATTLGDVN